MTVTVVSEVARVQRGEKQNQSPTSNINSLKFPLYTTSGLVHEFGRRCTTTAGK